MININNRAYLRISGIAASLFLLCFVLFAGRWIEMIPLAALIGLMFVVCEKTFEWSSLKMLAKIPKQDALLVIIVTVITVMTDLAIAVIAGVILGALFFAWEHAKLVTVNATSSMNGIKTYDINGSLFFGSTAHFRGLFTPMTDPEIVILDFRFARVFDHSAIDAVESLASRYRSVGKRVVLRHLSPDCQNLLRNSGSQIESNSAEDPIYRVTDDRFD